MSEPHDDRRIQTVCLILLTAVAMAFALHWLKSVLVPFILSYFFVTALEPLVGFQMQRLKVPRAVAIGLTMVVGVLVFAALSGGIAISVAPLLDGDSPIDPELGLEKLAEKITDKLDNIGISGDEIENVKKSLASGLQTIMGAIGKSVASLLSQGAMLLLFILFMLTGSQLRSAQGGVFQEIQRLVRQYIILKTFLSAITGIVVAAIFWSLGVELAFLFGLFAFLLNYIPTIGPVIATLFPLPFMFAQDPELTPTVIVLAVALPGIVQFVIGNVLEPRLLGKSLDLHPVAVLLALAFWGTLWGGIGALLAVPITSVVKILLERLEPTAPIAEALAGRIGAPSGES